MFGLPLLPQGVCTFRLAGQTIVHSRPSSAKVPNIGRPTSLHIHEGHGAFDLGNNSLLLQ